MFMGEVDIGFRPATLPHITHVVIREEVDLGIKRPAIIHLLIMEKLLMVILGVDIGLIPTNLPHIIQVMMKEEVDLGLNRPSNITF